MILGIGNPILKDDGVGPRVIHELRSSVSDPDITLLETSLAGMNLMEALVGFHHAIIIDAIQTGGKPGTLYRLTPEDFVTQHKDTVSQHQIGLLQALQLGKELSQPMPDKVVLIAIEAEDVHNFGEKLTPPVEAAVPRAVDLVLAEIQGVNDKKAG